MWNRLLCFAHKKETQLQKQFAAHNLCYSGNDYHTRKRKLSMDITEAFHPHYQAQQVTYCQLILIDMQLNKIKHVILEHYWSIRHL